MLFGDNRRELRQMYFNVWQKHQQQSQLEPLEQQIILVIMEHPEYHPMFEQAEKYLEQEYLPEFGESNPFLHMGLHLSIREQVQTNRPNGIQQLYQQMLMQVNGDHLQVEHNMMECLMEQLWQSQRNNQPLDEAGYLVALNTLKNKR